MGALRLILQYLNLKKFFMENMAKSLANSFMTYKIKEEKNAL